MTRIWLRLFLLICALTLAASASAQNGKDVVAPVAELPSVPAVLPDVSALEGRKVVALRAKMEGQLWPTPPKLLAPKVGEPFVLAEARAELLRLLEGGGFAGGTLELEPVSSGVEVVFRLTPSRLVRRVVFKGNELEDDPVRRAGGLVEVRDVTEKSLDEAGKKVQAYYVLRGFPKAKVVIGAIETDLPNVVLVQVGITPGEPLKVRRRVFAALPTWDAGAMAAAQAYAVGTGDRADEEALDLADRGLASALRAGGFPQAAVTHAVAPGEGGVVLTVNTVSGPRVIPSFEGNVVFDRQSLLDVLDLKNEADRSPVRLVGKLETAYRKLGYLDVLVEYEMLGAATDQTRTLLFRIREGQPVSVAKRVYPCLTGALSAARIDEEIDSFLDEELAGEGFGDAPQGPVDDTIGGSGGGGGAKPTGAHPKPSLPGARAVFFGETYEHARDHLVELFRSEGYMFVEVAEVGILRGSCAKGSMPGPQGCKVVAPASYDESKLCSFDANRLPLPIPPLDKKLACQADPLKGLECAPTLTVVLPINPGPRSFLWDVTFDGTQALAPATLAKVAGSTLRMGDPLSLKDLDAARKAIVEHYRDEGFAFASVRVAFEYSPDKSRARVRFLVNEGEQVVIDKIFVEGERHTLESLVRARLLLEEGGVYRARLVRESQDRLARLGIFSSISIGLVNPNIPGKRKSVVVNVVERPRQLFDYRVGWAVAEGLRFFGEYSYGNLFGYAASLNLRLKFSWQNFWLCPARGDCPFYDETLISRWTKEVNGLDNLPRRISAGVSLPHTPFFGSAVRSSAEAVNVLDLRRDFVLNKWLLPVLTFTYAPIQPLTVVLGTDLEVNFLKTLGQQNVEDILRNSGGALAPLLRVPRGNSSVTAVSGTMTLDWRDNRLGATKNGYVSFSSEWVRSNGWVITEAETKQDFLHLTGGGAAYLKLPIGKEPVLAFSLFGGLNVNVGRCLGVGDTNKCDTYPDRLFYLGGRDTNRGFYAGTMLPQDSIDELSANKDARLGSVPCSEYPTDPVTGKPSSVAAAGARSTVCDVSLASIASAGGNVYINPRIELRIPAFKWGGFVLFADAANTWRNRNNFRPWILRYSVGPGLSFDTPVGPVAFDFGFNLNRYAAFNEPVMAFNFSIGRF